MIIALVKRLVLSRISMFLTGLLDVLIPLTLLTVYNNLVACSVVILQLIIMALVYYFVDPRGRGGTYLVIGALCGVGIMIFQIVVRDAFEFRFYMLVWGFGHQFVVYATERLKKRNA